VKQVKQRKIILAAAAALAVLVPAAAPAAAAADPGFLRAEREVTGGSLSGSWRTIDFLDPVCRQIGGEGMDRDRQEVGQEIGGGAAAERPEEKDGGPSNTGDKIKAGALSLVLPGAGQFYNGDNKKGWIMAGIEAGIWTAWFVFDAQGDSRMDSAEEYAAIYAGTGGDHPDSYWQAVGRYMDSDTYEDYLRREARATGEALPDPLDPSDTWQWVNETRKYNFQKLRADGNAAYDRRDFMILFAVVNRAVSVFDAVMGAGDKPGTLETEVLGMDLSVGVVPSWRDPGARAVFSRNF
jgi:TM2 domain-containing membrane protein YozV